MAMSNQEFSFRVAALTKICDDGVTFPVEPLLEEVNSLLDEARLGKRSEVEIHGTGQHNLAHVRELCRAVKAFQEAVTKARIDAVYCAGGGCCCGG